MSTFADPRLLFGHRGANLRCPENTVPAFIAAIEDGANALELDVQLTSDGVVVVMHDDDGRRMCGSPGAVSDTPFATVKNWDPGAGFVDAAGARSFARRGLTVPRLADVLQAFPGIPINIDLKSPDPRGIGRVVDVVTALGAADRVLLTSFHDDVVAGVRSSSWSGRVGFSKGDIYSLLFLPLLVLRRRRARGDRVQLPVKAGPIRLDAPRFIDKMHELKIAVDYWVINDRAEGERLLAAGADGLMSDDPKVLAPLLLR
ncbi:MAG: glycerophosphodiester phosphodiesterase family protein [Deltaproteobacteria bacterium]|nr:glycerophosphodiester phosphodiesterase family protein [Deltaproteobacteria bacterium]